MLFTWARVLCFLPWLRSIAMEWLLFPLGAAFAVVNWIAVALYPYSRDNRAVYVAKPMALVCLILAVLALWSKVDVVCDASSVPLLSFTCRSPFLS